MNLLDELAKRLDAFEKVDDGYPFQRRARILQSLWRIEQNLGEPILDRGKRRGVCIDPGFARQGLVNFLDRRIGQLVVQEILEHGKTKMYGQPRIFNNLLSSQPLAFNLFGPMQADLDLATQVFRCISDGRVNAVTAITFEESPGRRDRRYLGDRSAFDVYVEFSGDRGAGFVGIEVKYHENLNNGAAGQGNPRYDQVADKAKCFHNKSRDRLKRRPLQQIWRDHLLALSILQKDADSFADGFFVFLSPKDNDACNSAVASYRECLSCQDTFEHWTLDRLVTIIRRFTRDPWIATFHDRYLEFEKVYRCLCRLCWAMGKPCLPGCPFLPE